jgi:tRNA A-37 threonylcarbamoyl transferase component Bud32
VLTGCCRPRLYSALKEIHAAGVLQGDIAPRNVVRRARGALCWIDFERSTLEHICPGDACEELADFRDQLGLAVSE